MDIVLFIIFISICSVVLEYILGKLSDYFLYLSIKYSSGSIIDVEYSGFDMWFDKDKQKITVHPFTREELCQKLLTNE